MSRRMSAALLAAAFLLILCAGCGGGPAGSADSGDRSDLFAPVSDPMTGQSENITPGSTTSGVGGTSVPTGSTTAATSGSIDVSSVGGSTTTTGTNMPVGSMGAGEVPNLSTPAESTTSATVTTTSTTVTTTGTAAPQSPAALTYEQYNALSGEEQLAYMESFASMADYFAWYNAAKKAYEDSQNRVEVSDGHIDLGGRN